ncbi:hypothetical protein [Mediterraneibacter sp.]|uniref:hypothetical protein n=1 Tax=Mediterraneibacter sp. TaxID=2316022 RepID=UPI0039955F19
MAKDERFDPDRTVLTLSFAKKAMKCKLRSNGMPVPLLRNCYSIFNGTKYR